MTRWILIFLVFALPAWPQSAAESTPLSGAEFDAYTQGKTLRYLQDGVPYGAEQYQSGGLVVWLFDGAECQKGSWFETDPGTICFEYDSAPNGPQCWYFYKTAKGLRAVLNGLSGSTELYETQQSTEPLFCPGPEIGV